MRRSILVLVAACSCAVAPAPRDAPDREMAARIAAAERRVEKFFGRSFIARYEVRVVPTRAAFQRIAGARWKSLGTLPCWAVAVGTGSTFLMLEPAAWKTEACDHASDTPEDVDRVIAHELVHVYHGQHRRSDPELDQAEEVGWFVEGLATFASGQLTEARVRELRELIASGGGPKTLAEVWTGKLRYAAAGTLVQFLDSQIGRQKVVALLPASSNAHLLAFASYREAELLAAWRADLLSRQRSYR